MSVVAPLSSSLLLAVLIAVAAVDAAHARAEGETVPIGWLSQAAKRTLPLSYLDEPPRDDGIQGAQLGVADNNTTGQFTGQSFALIEAIVPENGDVAAGFRELTAKGLRLVVTDLGASQLLSVAGLLGAGSGTLFHAAATQGWAARG